MGGRGGEILCTYMHKTQGVGECIDNIWWYRAFLFYFFFVHVREEGISDQKDQYEKICGELKCAIGDETRRLSEYIIHYQQQQQQQTKRKTGIAKVHATYCRKICFLQIFSEKDSMLPVIWFVLYGYILNGL